MREMTPKQAAFVDEYLLDMNATKAATRAGYSSRTAGWIGPQLLGKTHIAAAIRARIVERSARTLIDADRVLKELARIAFFDIRKLFKADGSPIPVNELDDDTAAAVAGLDIDEIYEGTGKDRVFIGYTRKYRMADKLEALALCMRHLGMFNDRLQIDVRHGLADRLATARAKHQAMSGAKH